MTDELESVTPCEPIAPWLGGKSRLAATIIKRIDAIPHKCYAEPFFGMGGVFLRRTRRPRAEFINDANGELANLFRILQRHPKAFIEMFRWQISSRVFFESLRRTDPATLTDLERAARYLYLQKLAFGGNPRGAFGVASDRPARFDISALVHRLEAMHQRLSGVTIECLDYAAFIQRYDRPGMLFYLDPPYYVHEDDYGKGLFGRGEFAKMARLLRALKGRFILSINDCPEVRGLFDGCEMVPVEVKYSAGTKGRSERRGELLILDGRQGEP